MYAQLFRIAAEVLGTVGGVGDDLIVSRGVDKKGRGLRGGLGFGPFERVETLLFD